MRASASAAAHDARVLYHESARRVVRRKARAGSAVSTPRSASASFAAALAASAALALAITVALASALASALPPSAAAATPAEAAALCTEILLRNHADDILGDAKVLDIVATDDDLGQAPESVAVARCADDTAQAAHAQTVRQSGAERRIEEQVKHATGEHKNTFQALRSPRT